MKFALLFLLLANPLLGADVKLAWDASTESWEAVKIYEKVTVAGAPTYVKVGEVPGAATSITLTNVTPGVHTYIARSFVTPWESNDSNEAITPLKPSAPGGLKVTVTVTVTVP